MANRKLSCYPFRATHDILPKFVVHFDSINCFKSRLDKFWYNQDVLYNWEADFTGTGNRSLFLLQSIILIELVNQRCEEAFIEALPASVNFRCLVLPNRKKF